MYQQWLQSHRSKVSAWSCVSSLLTARPCQKREVLPLPLSRGNHGTGLTGQYTKAACYQQEIHLAQETAFCQAREAKGLYVQSDQCQTRRTSAGGTACRGGMWGGVLSFTGQERAIISAQTTLHNLTLSSQSHFALEDSNLAPAASVFSFLDAFSIILMFSHWSAQLNELHKP